MCQTWAIFILGVTLNRQFQDKEKNISLNESLWKMIPIEISGGLKWISAWPLGSCERGDWMHHFESSEELTMILMITTLSVNQLWHQIIQTHPTSKRRKGKKKKAFHPVAN